MANPNKPLKIGLVIDDSLDKPDGVQQYVLTIGQWLSSQGHEVHYLTGQTRRDDLPNLHSLSRNLNVRFNRNRMSMPLPSNRAKLKAFLDEQQFDVLHVQLPHSPWLAHCLVLLADPRTAIIGTFHIAAHSALVTQGTKLLGRWTRRSIGRFDEILSVSTAAQALAKQAYKVDTSVLPNAFDYPRFNQAKPLKKYQDDKLNVLFLGRLVPRKGCQVLLRALSLLKAENLPDFRVLICGKGPLLGKFQTYAQNNHLNNVEFVGFVSENEKPAYYASADLAVFPSTGGESFGIVLLEAMASGQAAVIAGDNSGYRTVMQPQPELLIEPNRPDLLAAKIQELLKDKAKRQKMAAWGADYSKQFDAGVIGRQLEEHYRRALRNRQP